MFRDAWRRWAGGEPAGAGQGRRVAAAAVAGSGAGAAVRAAEPRSFSRVVDLTHAIGPDFPTYDGGSNLAMETIVTLAKDGYNMYRWQLVEHTGTHMDAPIHFGDGVQSADQIPIEHLVVPLAIVDIRAKAQDDADAQMTPDDLVGLRGRARPDPGWRLRRHALRLGRAGRRARVPQRRRRRRDALPGLSRRGRAVSHGRAQRGRHRGRHAVARLRQVGRFATHYAWLPTNRWGLEAVAKLGELPPTGATLVVGGPKIKGATGGPSRVLALL